MADARDVTWTLLAAGIAAGLAWAGYVLAPLLGAFAPLALVGFVLAAGWLFGFIAPHRRVALGLPMLAAVALAIWVAWAAQRPCPPGIACHAGDAWGTAALVLLLGAAATALAGVGSMQRRRGLASA